MFENANYRWNIAHGLIDNVEPKELIAQHTPISLRPGEPTTQTVFYLRLGSTMPVTHFSVGSPPVQIPPTNEPYSGDGKLQIYSMHGLGVTNLAILDVSSNKS
jgi:hypothetical protein